MMKKAFALFLCTALLLLSACGRSSEPDVTDAEQSSVTQAPEPITAQDLLAANESYGESAKQDGVLVRDESVQYRTEDSRKLEAIAVRAAEDMVRSKLSDPDSLEINDCIVSNCADDGDNTYYDVSFSVSYALPTGERIDNSDVCTIGVHKSDASTFDASKDIKKILDRYSIFQKTEERIVYTPEANESDAASSAAEKIAASHLKDASSGKVLSARQRPDGSDGSVFTWEVLCEGVNDFGMRIQDVYTAFLVYSDGNIIEYDPAEPDANIF